MVGQGRVIGIVPARAGSKGLPGKNFRALEGISPVERALRGAVGSDGLSTVLLSSDDHDAARVAEVAGVRLHKRSPFAASDEATAKDVVVDVLTWLRSIGERLDDALIAYLQPTSVMRTSTHIDEALELRRAKSARSCVSVRNLEVPIHKAVLIGSDGTLAPAFSEKLVSANRQSLPAVYIPNGAIYVFTVEDFERSGNIPIKGAVPYLMSPRDSLDIDSSDDWDRAAKELRSNG